MIEETGARQFLITGTARDVGQAAESLIEVYRGLLLGNEQISALRLALDEALSNAIRHGHHGDVTKEIRVDCFWDPAKVRLVVTDQGEGFNCRLVPDPTSCRNLLKECGRGLYIISAIMSDVSFNEKGNRISMTLNRTTC